MVQTRKLIIPVALLLFAVIILSQVVDLSNLSVTGGSYSVLSMSKMEFVSSNSELAGSAWKILLSAQSSAERLTGTISTTDMDNALPDGYKATKPFTLFITNYKEQCGYNLGAAKAISSYSLNRLTFTCDKNILGICLNKASDKCKAYSTPSATYGVIGGGIIEAGKAYPMFAINFGTGTPISLSVPFDLNQYYVPSVDCYNVKRELVGYYSPFTTNGKPIWSADASLKIGEESTQTKTISSTSGNVLFDLGGNKKAILQELGSTVTGEQCPMSSEKAVYVVQSGAQYKRFVATGATNYAYQSSLLENMMVSQVAYSNVEAQINTMNTEKSNIVSGRYTDYAFGTQYGTLDQLKVSYITTNAPNRLLYPLITLQINAEWLGVEKLVAKPIISSNTCTSAAEKTTVSFAIKNDATTEGNAQYSVSCPSAGILQSGNVDLFGGEVKTVTFTGTESSGTQQTCTISVKDTAGTGASDAKTCSYVGSACIPKACGAGETYSSVSCSCICVLEPTDTQEVVALQNGGCTLHPREGSTCNNDGTCGVGESHGTCPADCPSIIEQLPTSQPADNTMLYILIGGGILAVIFISQSGMLGGRRR